jgi:hypothetical protein
MMEFDQYSYVLHGRIVEFFPEDQTANIKICTDRAFSNSSNLRGLMPREVLQRVPCHTPSGGGWSMTMPITAGNTCILFFNQVGYDHWLYEDKDTAELVAGDPAPHLSRHFDENDGYALVGLNTIPRAVQDYHATNSEWRGPVSADQVIRLKPDHHIEIESSVQVTVIAPSVLVECESATVNTDTAEVNATETVDVTAGTSASVTTPTLTLACATAIDATTPILTVSGNLVVGGSAAIAAGIGGGGAAPPASGMEITGPSKIDGNLESTGNIAVTGSGVIDGVNIAGHTHTSGGSGNPSSPPT